VKKLSTVQLKWIKNLHSKKGRESEGYYIAEGEKLLNEILVYCRQMIHLVVCTHENELIVNTIDANQLLLASPSEFERISLLKSPQGILIVLKMSRFEANSFDLGTATLVLDNIQDPGNLGTIIRSADWFGIKQLFCSESTVDCYNPKVVQASMGSLFRIQISYGHLTDFLSKQTLPIYGALLEGESCFTHKIQESAILVIGNEGNGISKEIMTYIQHPITIPRIGNGESLNVAVASGILLAQWLKS